ncbi:MAG: dTDP-4-dehydrorhamnose reductase [Pseudomonadota bacterium]
MHVLVFGHSGQVATELRARAGDDLRITALSRAEADLTHSELCVEAIATHAPDAVINAAAYTAVDKAEDEEAIAQVVNAEAPGAMALISAEMGLPFVTLSTDYVFSGTGTRGWRPDDPTGPQGAYGRTKLAGEEAVRAAGGTAVILRTSWVVSAHGSNFVKTMLRLGAERESLSIVADQIGGPTPAGSIAEACLTITRHLLEAPEKAGTYHFSGTPDVSWAGFAREIFEQAGLACAVTDIPSSDYPTPATRPLNSRMDCSATDEVFGVKRPDWRAGLSDILTQLKTP